MPAPIPAVRGGRPGARRRALFSAFALATAVAAGCAAPSGSPADGTERGSDGESSLSWLVGALHEPLPTDPGTGGTPASPGPTGASVVGSDSVPAATADIRGGAMGELVVLRPVPCDAASRSDDQLGASCGASALHSGTADGREFVAVLQFDLSRLPLGSEVRYAGLELTGLDDAFLRRAGEWEVRIVDLPESRRPGHMSFGQLVAVPDAVPPVAWRLRSRELAPGGRNVLEFDQGALDLLAVRLGHDRVAFRIEGPVGESNLFSWAAVGDEGPRLRVGYVAMPGADEAAGAAASDE